MTPKIAVCDTVKIATSCLSLSTLEGDLTRAQLRLPPK
jgi:hypothetical protein